MGDYLDVDGGPVLLETAQREHFIVDQATTQVEHYSAQRVDCVLVIWIGSQSQCVPLAIHKTKFIVCIYV